jgi:hypothetical protein
MREESTSAESPDGLVYGPRIRILRAVPQPNSVFGHQSGVDDLTLAGPAHDMIGNLTDGTLQQ